MKRVSKVFARVSLCCATVAAMAALTMVSSCCGVCGARGAKGGEEQKIVIYQVFTRLFGSDQENPTFNGSLSENGVGKFEDFTQRALDSISAMGMTHIWYTGVIEHASIYASDTTGGANMNHAGVIKGRAGSPYAIKDYYDVNEYLAIDPAKRMEEFEALVKRSHAAGMGVVIDFIPNHVARGYHSDMAPEGVADFGAEDDNTVAFAANNNYYYIPGEALKPQFDTALEGMESYYEYPAKVTGNDVFSASPHVNDWYETIKINYGVDYQNGHAKHFDPIPNTWFKMRDILLYWAGKGVDGFRCDMAEMTPHEFWGWAIGEVKAQYPDMIFIAEIYNPASYETYIHEGGFDYLYDKVGLYDALKDVVRGRRGAEAISENREKIAAVQPYMLNFLENHDEQRIAWHEFAGDAQAGLPMMLVSTLSDNIPMMIYFGQELGEEAPEATGFSGADGRTTIFDFWTVPSLQAWRNGGLFDGAGLTAEQKQLRADNIAILKMAQEQLFIDGAFVDMTLLTPSSSRTVYAFARHTDSEAAVVVANLSNKSVVTSYALPAELSEICCAACGEVTYNANGAAMTIDEILSETGGELTFDLAPYQAVVLKFGGK